MTTRRRSAARNRRENSCAWEGPFRKGAFHRSLRILGFLHYVTTASEHPESSERDTAGSDSTIRSSRVCPLFVLTPACPSPCSSRPLFVARGSADRLGACLGLSGSVQPRGHAWRKGRAAWTDQYLRHWHHESGFVRRTDAALSAGVYNGDDPPVVGFVDPHEAPAFEASAAQPP
jgi:hypothetical protein